MPKQFFKYFLFLTAYLLFFIDTKAQGFNFKITNTDSSDIFKYVSYKPKYSSEREANSALNSIINELRFKGYLLANVDSVRGDSLNKNYFLSTGKKYKWAYIKKGNSDAEVMSRIGFSEKLYTNKPFNYKQTARLIEKTIGYYENNGYPFASLKLDSVTLSENSISAVLNVDKNKLFKIDSIIVKGDAKINKTFLYRYLSISPLMRYNQSALAGISKKIKQLSFLTESQTPVMQFRDKQNKLYLFLNKKNASQFDGIIGVLPDKSGKTIFTGDVKIKLINNIFHAGETFDLNWRRLQTQTQDFNGRVIYPFLFGTPIGTDYAIKIYKKDSSFIDVNNKSGIIIWSH